jgi:hypothetical protein
MALVSEVRRCVHRFGPLGSRHLGDAAGVVAIGLIGIVAASAPGHGLSVSFAASAVVTQQDDCSSTCRTIASSRISLGNSFRLTSSLAQRI